MSGKRQLSIFSFALRGKPPKNGRLQDAGREKVAKRVGPLEKEETEKDTMQVEETVEETLEDTVQVEEEETVEETVEEMARLGCQKTPSKEKGEKYQEQPPIRALLIMNGPLNVNVLL